MRLEPTHDQTNMFNLPVGSYDGFQLSVRRMLEFLLFKLEFEELPQITGKFIDDLVLESLVVEFANLLLRAVAAIGMFLPVRESVQATVALRFSWYSLKIDEHDLQPST